MQKFRSNTIIGVIGGGHCSRDIEILAENVGENIARQGGILICGGLYGVMEAACRGAKKQGGTTIGILPGADKSEANRFVDIPIVTGLADARNVIIARTADGVIAVNGEYGTLSEIAFCLKFNKPVVGLQTWGVDAGIVAANDAKEAVDKIFRMIDT
ncbi:MAG: TIGR00725 family protein [bacterium]